MRPPLRLALLVLVALLPAAAAASDWCRNNSPPYCETCPACPPPRPIPVTGYDYSLGCSPVIFNLAGNLHHSGIDYASAPSSAESASGCAPRTCCSPRRRAWRPTSKPSWGSDMSGKWIVAGALASVK